MSVTRLIGTLSNYLASTVLGLPQEGGKENPPPSSKPAEGKGKDLYTPPAEKKEEGGGKKEETQKTGGTTDAKSTDAKTEADNLKLEFERKYDAAKALFDKWDTEQNWQTVENRTKLQEAYDVLDPSLTSWSVEAKQAGTYDDTYLTGAAQRVTALEDRLGRIDKDLEAKKPKTKADFKKLAQEKIKAFNECLDYKIELKDKIAALEKIKSEYIDAMTKVNPKFKPKNDKEVKRMLTEIDKVKPTEKKEETPEEKKKREIVEVLKKALDVGETKEPKEKGEEQQPSCDSQKGSGKTKCELEADLEKFETIIKNDWDTKPEYQTKANLDSMTRAFKKLKDKLKTWSDKTVEDGTYDPGYDAVKQRTLAELNVYIKNEAKKFLPSSKDTEKPKFYRQSWFTMAFEGAISQMGAWRREKNNEDYPPVEEYVNGADGKMPFARLKISFPKAIMPVTYDRFGRKQNYDVVSGRVPINFGSVYSLTPQMTAEGDKGYPIDGKTFGSRLMLGIDNMFNASTWAFPFVNFEFNLEKTNREWPSFPIPSAFVFGGNVLAGAVIQPIPLLEVMPMVKFEGGRRLYDEKNFGEKFTAKQAELSVGMNVAVKIPAEAGQYAPTVELNTEWTAWGTEKSPVLENYNKMTSSKDGAVNGYKLGLGIYWESALNNLSLLFEGGQRFLEDFDTISFLRFRGSGEIPYVGELIVESGRVLKGTHYYPIDTPFYVDVTWEAPDTLALIRSKHGNINWGLRLYYAEIQDLYMNGNPVYDKLGGECFVRGSVF